MTHAANRLRRRKALKALPFTDEDAARFGKLVAAATAAAAYPEGETKKLSKARRAVRGRTLPPGQAVVGSPFDRLCRMADRWASMLATARIDAAEELAGLAQACGDVLATLNTGRERRGRADIEG